jgi:hypothetical protein
LSNGVFLGTAASHLDVAVTVTSGSHAHRRDEELLDAIIAEELRQADLRCSANDLLLVEQARGWLLGEGD